MPENISSRNIVVVAWAGSTVHRIKGVSHIAGTVTASPFNKLRRILLFITLLAFGLSESLSTCFDLPANFVKGCQTY